ncbi:hypothetical protein [Vibrio vulnificus]|uniref:hypothetical protein n=1 Tax=Vibrio vulnificus TaxID=672 RepID=UPI001A1BF1BB|nr:hypothetical protein [Vibrio vulnificus]MCA0769185.1 hypothetical protein [Vibrio vulnificus]HAS6242317.1 hypothetical protein [Vibrio vulnificus]HDY7945152.1 hypothetical protein [Vibrio vulnificus]
MKKILLFSALVASPAYAINYQTDNFHTTCDILSAGTYKKEMISRVGNTIAISDSILGTRSYTIESTLPKGKKEAFLFIADEDGWNEHQVRKRTIDISFYGDSLSVTNSTAVLFKRSNDLIAAASSYYQNCK